MFKEINFVHSVTHFGLVKVERTLIPSVGMTLRLPYDPQIYVVKHMHTDYDIFNGEDYVTVYIEEYIPSENDSWAK
jgi:hypothetical protein